MSKLNLEFARVDNRGSFEPMAAGTAVRLFMIIRPGGQGEDGLLKPSAKGDCLGLDAVFAVVGGPYDGRKIFAYMVMSGTTAGSRDRRRDHQRAAARDLRGWTRAGPERRQHPGGPREAGQRRTESVQRNRIRRDSRDREGHPEGGRLGKLAGQERDREGASLRRQGLRQARPVAADPDRPFWLHGPARCAGSGAGRDREAFVGGLGRRAMNVTRSLDDVCTLIIAGAGINPDADGPLDEATENALVWEVTRITRGADGEPVAAAVVRQALRDRNWEIGSKRRGVAAVSDDSTPQLGARAIARRPRSIARRRSPPCCRRSASCRVSSGACRFITGRGRRWSASCLRP